MRLGTRLEYVGSSSRVSRVCQDSAREYAKRLLRVAERSFRNDAVGKSLGVLWEVAEGVGSLPRWRKGVRRKKTETHRKIIGGSQKACWEFNHDGESELQIRHGSRIKLMHQAKDWTMRWELVGSSLGLRQRYREDH
ncbi:hypothetical protein BHM03_00017791 [Ensete ventricosum]|nr:hypothetical protein BHM03_00017791 [Ensete ventricosum]